MKSSWKKWVFWSSLGGMAVGAAVALARKARPAEVPVLDFQRIPADCQRASLWTEQYRSEDHSLAVQDKYVLQLTPFKVWSVLEMGASHTGEKPEGVTIYHVTHLRYAGDAAGDRYPDEGRLQDRFYGTITVTSPENGRRSPKNHIARGCILEIHKCLVGGGRNGVETGEVHRSAAPILNYRFEYNAR